MRVARRWTFLSLKVLHSPGGWHQGACGQKCGVWIPKFHISDAISGTFQTLESTAINTLRVTVVEGEAAKGPPQLVIWNFNLILIPSPCHMIHGALLCNTATTLTVRVVLK